MALLHKSLDAASAIGPGSVVHFDKPKSILSLQVVTTGFVANAAVELDISLNGTDWVIARTITGAISLNGDGISGGEGIPPALHARARVNLLDPGATVTAWIAAAE